MRKILTEEQINFLNELPEKYGDMLTKNAYLFFGCQPHMYPVAQDAVQEVYIKAVKNVEVLMAHENPVGWLYQSLRYTLLHTSRHMKTRKEYLTADISETSDVSKQVIMDALDRWEQQYTLSDVIETVSTTLTKDEQSTFKNYFLIGYSTQETAKIEHTTTDTIRNRISRIRKKLKKVLGNISFLVILLHYFY